MQQTAFAIDQRLSQDGNPNVRGIAAQGLAKESGWSHADNREGVPLDYKGRAKHRGIGSVICLPRMMTDHGDGCGRSLVVRWRKKMASKCTNAECREVVSTDELGAQRFGGIFVSLSANAQPVDARLE